MALEILSKTAAKSSHEELITTAGNLELRLSDNDFWISVENC